MARVYVQAVNALMRKEHDTAGMAFRKVLDIGLNAYDSTLKGQLVQRIDALAARHDITPSMRKWAHQVRLVGNEIAHEATEPSEADIKAIASFTETLLKYLFTLPEEVRLRKAGTTMTP